MTKQFLFISALFLAIFVVAGLTMSVQADETLSATISGPSSANVGDSVTFSVQVTGGSGFYTYNWDFGDGEQAAGESVDHSFGNPGPKTITVLVTDTNNVQDSDSITVNIVPVIGPTDPPTLDFRANGQTSSLSVSSTTPITLTWDSSLAFSCVASGDWSGNKTVDGSEDVGSLGASNSKTFTLTCTGEGGVVAKSITITVSSTPSSGLRIVNVRVTDVTRSSAIIRWETVDLAGNPKAADSRVIYDTASHPDISGQSAPNYGYQFSTGTDTALVTSHAVTVSGLSSNTKYYFRAISEN